jgi:hypothetical protein
VLNSLAEPTGGRLTLDSPNEFRRVFDPAGQERPELVPNEKKLPHRPD